MLYDGNVIAKETNVISIADSEETLILKEESQSKMFLKQNFGKRFVPQRELSDEQALHHIIDQSASSPVKIEAPRELPKITPNALTEGEWGFEHTKAVFQNEIIPFLKTLKDIFNVFDKDLLNKKQFWNENGRLLDQIISQDIVNIVVNSSVDPNTSMNVNSSVAMIKSVNYVEIESVKEDLDEIETINIELEHRVTKLIAENEHLKQTYKQLYDSIKPSRVRAKEQTDSLVKQVNQNSVEVTDLIA
ncbi:hypothetical protein Tco_1552443 [Tanacetum coccineum]